MKRLIAACVTVGLAIPVGIGVTATFGAAADTDCWDEYNLSGNRFYGTLTPKDLPIEDCTPADWCYTGYNRAGTKNRLFVPHGANPGQACAALSTTTSTTTTSAPSTTTPAAAGDRFVTLPPGSALPSDVECASRVRPMTENRPGNAPFNAVRGTMADANYPRVTGDFVGTTDEIIQWTACKWGIDEDLVRAQIIIESWWQQPTLGDFTTDPSMCAPGYPIGDYPAQSNGDVDHNGQCPESIGLGQVRWFYHQSAFADGNAAASSAYNLDYTYAVWRACYEGEFGWLNTVEGRGDYAAGDASGCQGVWFSGRWYTSAAMDYIGRIQDHVARRTWEEASFEPAFSRGTVIATGTSTTLPASTTTTTSAPTTSAPSQTSPTVASAAFVETFDGNTGLDRFDHNVFNRDPAAAASGTVSGDHDLNCGGPDTQRIVHASNPDESFYLCKDHLMTAIGDWDGYSTGWFSPKQTFTNEQKRVAWDVNVTDLLGRQWWEVMIVPTSFSSGVQECPYCAVTAWMSPDPTHLPTYPNGAVVVGNGPLGKDVNIHHNGKRYTGWQHVCGAYGWFDVECDSKAIRVPFSVTDNGNGTITVDYGGKFTETFSGSFPTEYRVVFKDHNYTPNKDGMPVGHTWHWDNIVVQ